MEMYLDRLTGSDEMASVKFNSGIINTGVGQPLILQQLLLTSKNNVVIYYNIEAQN